VKKERKFCSNLETYVFAFGMIRSYATDLFQQRAAAGRFGTGSALSVWDMAAGAAGKN